MLADNGDPALDVRTAADLLRQTEQDTREALTVRLAVVYAVWGLAWLVGLSAMWLSVRDQHPYRGPSGLSSAVTGVMLLVAQVVTIVVVARASHGVRGESLTRGWMYGSSWMVGFGAIFSIAYALQHAGASPAVIGVISAAGPVFVVSLIYVVSAMVWLDRVMFGLGVWLAAVAGIGAWTGPVRVLLVVALAGAAGLFTAALLAHRRTA